MGLSPQSLGPIASCPKHGKAEFLSWLYVIKKISVIDTDEGGAYVAQMLAQILSAGMQAWSIRAFGGEHFISKS